MPEGGSPARSSWESVITEQDVVKASGGPVEGPPAPLYSRTAQTDAPEFKRWFGDWESLARRNTLESMAAYLVAPGSIGAAPSTREAVKLARETYRALQNEIAQTRDGRIIQFGGTGFRETAHHAADRRVLEIIPQLRGMLGDAVPLGSDTQATPSDKNIKAFHHYGIKARFTSGEAFVRLVVREEVNGNFYYDNDATSVEETQASRQPPLPRAKAGARQSPPTPVRNRLVAWWQSVNPDAVSKVLDEKGKPLVVYHGTTEDIKRFDPRKSGIGGSFFFSADPAFAGSPAYTGSFRGGGNVVPVFLNIRNPARVEREESYNPFIEGGIIHRANRRA